MCARRGFILNWDFSFYCLIAHYSSEGIRDQIYKDFPDLYKQEPDWKVLYKEKTDAYIELIDNGAVKLMPYVKELLEALEKTTIKKCVVTNSFRTFIDKLKKQNPLLETINYWVTRENYVSPKPSSECYLKAIEQYSQPQDKIIGFEDTPRGLTALMGTNARPVLVTELNYPEIPSFINKGAYHFKTFADCRL
jgi:HAD superfamily hydrolase (TIGR01509 family)